MCKKTTIYIAVFQESVVDVSKEEEKIKNIWKQVEEIRNKDVKEDYTIKVDYYKPDYRMVVEKKYEYGLYSDIGISHDRMYLNKWLEKEEILGSFYYDELIEEEEFMDFIKSEDIHKGWKVKGE